jgi:predicted nucleic acid-binding protein
LDEFRSRAKDGEWKILTSAISIAEVSWIPDDIKLPIQQTRQILKFFENDYVELWQADRFICEEAHHLTRLCGLLPMDAIHIATAVEAKPEMVLTTDSKKGRRNGLLAWDMRFGKPALPIKSPDTAIHLPLWASAKRTTKIKEETNQPELLTTASGIKETDGKAESPNGQAKTESNPRVIREGSTGSALNPAKEEALPKEEAK